MGILDTLAKSFSPDQLLGFLNNMPDADLEKALRDLEPRLSPAKFGIFLQVLSEGLDRRHPRIK